MDKKELKRITTEKLIFGMLDWNKPSETQARGIELAVKTNEIRPFLQPITKLYGKNVWENCAKIISEYDDKKLERYLFELLKWLMDMNWPGAFIILDRINNFSDKSAVKTAKLNCLLIAKQTGDEVWTANLEMIKI